MNVDFQRCSARNLCDSFPPSISPAHVTDGSSKHDFSSPALTTFRINTCISVASKRLYLSLETTLTKKPGEGGGGVSRASLPPTTPSPLAVHSSSGLLTSVPHSRQRHG